MWEDFFYFSKGERRAIIVLSFILVLLTGAYIFLPEAEVDQTTAEEMKQFREEVQQPKAKKRTYPQYERTPQREVVLSHFDPNIADSIAFLDLGLPPFMARNILKYRAAGGKFRTPEDFARIYGLSEEKYNELKPYIHISEAFRRQKRDTARFEQKVKRDTLLYYKYPEGTLVDVSTADTTELKKIPGIGSGIAKLIVAYRRQLGGFYTVEQLREVDYVTEDMMQWFKLESDSITKINANKASLDKLRNHPYINFYQAKVIIEYRRKKGSIKSLSQLSLYEEFTEKDLERLSHYLSFE